MALTEGETAIIKELQIIKMLLATHPDNVKKELLFEPSEKTKWE